VTLALLLCAPRLEAVSFERSGNYWAFPDFATTSSPLNNWIRVQWSGGWLNFTGNNATPGEYYTVKTGGASLKNDNNSITVVLPNGQTYDTSGYYTVINSGFLYLYNPDGTYADVLGSHYDNICSVLMDDYKAWLDGMRGNGYNLSVGPESFQMYLTGAAVNLPPQLGVTGEGGFPPPSGGTGSGSGGSSSGGSSGSGSSSSSTVNGNVTQNNTTTNNYEYNYTINNNGGSGGEVNVDVDLDPVVDAINAGTSAIGDKLDYLTTHVVDANTAISDKLDGITEAITATGEPGDNPLTTASSAGAVAAGTEAAGTKFGGLQSAMTVGSGAAQLAIAIPFPTGDVTYSITSAPEPGSAFDTFRIVLRACLTVLVGLGFIAACIKTLRFY
jgi:hypothetical protein